MTTLTVLIGMWLSGIALAVVIIWLLYENHKAMNSRLSELLVATQSLARAEGFTAGQKNHENNMTSLRRAGDVLERQEQNRLE